MSKEFSRRDFIKTLGAVAGSAILSSCTHDLSRAISTMGKIIAPASTNIPKETVSPASTATFTKTPDVTESSTPTPTSTPECKPLGLTDEAKEFLASHEAIKGDTSRNVVLMTYDDMQSHTNFTTILDAYKYFGAKTTFFLPGGYSRNIISLGNYTSEIERIVSDGHVFGCHGLIHDPLTTYDSDQIRKDIEEWFKIVKEIIPGHKLNGLDFLMVMETKEQEKSLPSMVYNLCNGL